MRNHLFRFHGTFGLAVGALLMAGGAMQAQDWPQWRGPYRDGRAPDFKAPATWPKELAPKWKVTVGEGVATPSLVGDRLYVFSRQDGNEVIRCLEAATGKELWADRYESLGATGPSQGFSGPRSSPAVAEGKVVTIGVRGVVSCLDAATGKVLWRKDDFKAWPNFFVASSPLIADGLCIAQLGGRDNGAIVAYALATGDEKWRWSGACPSYASPVGVTVDGVKLIVAQTEANVVAVNAKDGKRVWESAPASPAGGGPGGPGGGRGGGRDYKATTPVVDGATVIHTVRGSKAWRFEKSGDTITAKELWSSEEKPVQFASSVLKNGLVFGLSAANEFFCLDAANGKLLWSAPLSQAAAAPEAAAHGGPGGGMRRGGMGGGGYGSLVDAGSVLLALTPASELIVYEPSREAFKEKARIKVASSPTHAYPVVSGQRLFIKDRDSVSLLVLE